MTKNELVRELAEELEFPRRDIAGIIEALIEKMTGVLKAGDKVQLTPFGQFKIRDRAARGNGGLELTPFRRFGFDPRLLSFAACAGAALLAGS
jgi:hypothetical protein